MATLVAAMAQAQEEPAPLTFSWAPPWVPAKVRFEPDGENSCPSRLTRGELCPGFPREEVLSLRCELANRSLQERVKITRASANAVIQLARSRGVHVVMRHVTPEAPGLSLLGYVPKPMYVKLKSCSAADQLIGAPKGCFGMVVLFKPTDLPAAGKPFETHRGKIVAAIRQQASKTPATPRPPAVGQGIPELAHYDAQAALLALARRVEAVTYEEAAKRRTDRQEEAAAFDGHPTIESFNAHLLEDQAAYVKKNAVPSAGVPLLADEPSYPHLAAYQAAVLGKGRVPGDRPMYLVTVHPNPARGGAVFAYIGDLDLFDVHVQRQIPEDATFMPQLDMLPWSPARRIAATPRAQLPPEVANSLIPYFLNDLGADVLHGPHMFWRSWYNARDQKGSKSLLSFFLGIIKEHRTSPLPTLTLLTPACNVCAVRPPSEAEVDGLIKDIIRRPDADDASIGSKAMSWHYRCEGTPMIPELRDPPKVVKTCAEEGEDCDTLSCCDPEHRCYRKAPGKPLQCVAADYCIPHGAPCPAMDNSAAPCCESKDGGKGCPADGICAE